MGFLKPMHGELTETYDGLPPLEVAKRPSNLGGGGFAAWPLQQEIETNSRLARIEALQQRQVVALERIAFALERR